VFALIFFLSDLKKRYQKHIGIFESSNLQFSAPNLDFKIDLTSLSLSIEVIGFRTNSLCLESHIVYVVNPEFMFRKTEVKEAFVSLS